SAFHPDAATARTARRRIRATGTRGFRDRTRAAPSRSPTREAGPSVSPPHRSGSADTRLPAVVIVAVVIVVVTVLVEPLRHEVGQVCFVERKHEKLVRVVLAFKR